MALPLDVEDLVKVGVIASGVDVRAEVEIDDEPPQVHVLLYFWDMSELENAVENMASKLDSVSLRTLLFELSELLDNVDIELLIGNSCELVDTGHGRSWACEEVNW